MSFAAASLLVLLVTGAPARPQPQISRYEVGLRLFNQGDVDAALKALDAAAHDNTDQGSLERIHLLRAQCFAARQDFVRAEEAFTLALEANPEATLDPSKVDPTLVKLLDGVRSRLTGTLDVRSTPPGAALELDGKPVGEAPQTLQAGVGKRTLTARWGSGAPQSLELQVRPRREVRVEWVQGAATTPGTDWPTPRPVRPFGDLRGVFEPATTGSLGGGLELGGGFEFSYFRLGLWARLFPRFNVTPRFQFALPVMEQFNVLLEVGVPLTFLPDGLGVGLAGGGGVEYTPLKWLAGYVLVGGQHHLLWPQRNDSTAFTAVGGVRLRMP